MRIFPLAYYTFNTYGTTMAKLPTGLYILNSIFFKLSKAISGSTGQIYTIFFTKWKVFA